MAFMPGLSAYLCSLSWAGRRAVAGLHWALTRALPLALSLVFAGSAAAFTAPLTLQDDVPVHRVWPVVTVLADPSRQLAVQDVLADLSSFQAPPGLGGTLGVRAEAIWLRIPVTVAPDSDGLWVLDIDYPVLRRVDVYLITQGQARHQASLGSLAPFALRPLRARSVAAPLGLTPGQSHDVLVRIETSGAMVLPITLSKPPAWHEMALNEQMLQGVLTGLALCLLIYSLAQWMHLRDVIFLHYALLISGSLLFSLHLFGLGSQFVWRDNAWMENHIAGLSALMATCGSFLFIGQALAAARMRSPLLRAMRWGAAFTALLALIYALDVIDTRIIVAIVSILGLVPALMGIPGALQRTRQGDPVGASLLLAWLVYFVATAIVIGVIRGSIPVNFWTLHSFQFGATLDMLLFMRVLGLRTKALRAQALHANRERDAMRSLAHTDALTGLPNRRGLNIALASALSRCGPDQLLAVYMMDLDGFKPVNDLHGHDVGDELLIAVTRRLKRQLRQSDVLARLGGDEFVVMTGGMDSADQALLMGNKLLHAFRTPFALAKVQVRVGLTIGYAIAPLDSNDAAALLKLADSAMYTGKQNGKFCIVRSPAGVVS